MNVVRRATHLESEAFRARHEVPRGKSRCYSSAVITFSGFPERWIIHYQVYKVIE